MPWGSGSRISGTRRERDGRNRADGGSRGSSGAFAGGAVVAAPPRVRGGGAAPRPPARNRGAAAAWAATPAASGALGRAGSAGRLRARRMHAAGRAAVARAGGRARGRGMRALVILLPAAVMSITPFLRIVVVLHFLRQALGTQSTPSNQVLIGLALFLALVIMQPVVADMYHQ